MYTNCKIKQQKKKKKKKGGGGGGGGGEDVFHVRMFEFQESIETVCKERNDKWANQVLGRLKFTIYLPAAEALYHQSYSVNFRTCKNIP